MKILSKTFLPKEVKYNNNIYICDEELSRNYNGTNPPAVKGIIGVHVLSRNLKGRFDYHGNDYQPTCWIFKQKPAEITPKVSTEYEVGAILSFSWGYEQTNYNFYCITKVSNDWVTLVEMTKKVESRGDMRTSVTPNEINLKSEPFRRKLARNRENGKPIGLQIESYGWCSLWDGKPKEATHYA